MGVSGQRSIVPTEGPGLVALLAVRFLLEIGALVGIVVGVAHAGDGPARWVIALGAAAIAAGVWGAFVAPKAKRRLRDPRRLIVELLVFFAGTAGLVAVTGSPLAWLAIAVAAVVALLVRISGAPA